MPMLTTINLRRWRIVVLTATAALLALATLTSAYAQFLPAILYGNHVRSGATIEAFIAGRSCGTTKVTADGEWMMQVPPEAPCKPIVGAAISFTIDGKAATSSPEASWESGGIPKGSIPNGYSLTAPGEPVFGASGSSGSGSASTDSSDSGGGSNMILFAGIGVILVAAVGGGVFLMRRKAQ
jgi:hypothetical protein